MNRRDLWWLGLAVVAGLAVGLVIRQTHGPFAAVASPEVAAQVTTRSPIPSAAPRPAVVQRASSSLLGSAPPVVDSAPAEFAAERAQCLSGGAVGSGNEGLLDDCSVLLAAKDTLRGTETLNWSADTAIANWDGITVSGSPRRVTRLYLDSNTSPQTIGRRLTLTGAIPAELGSLSKLERLTLSRHDLTGTIPAELGQLSKLTDLSLHNNELTGGIPAELGNLSNLTRLSLRNNPLGGDIPVELGSLSNLDTLSLENSHLTGGIPASLGDLSELFSLGLSRNTMLSGCIPASLRGLTLSDLSSLGLSYCTTTTTYALTTSAEGNGRISPLPGTYSYLSGESVTVTATPDVGHRVASWEDDCSGTASTCVLTMDEARTASVRFERVTYTLAVTATGGGSVTPAGTTTHDEDDEVTLTASWSDATHDFEGWGGDCAGTTASTCVLTMDANKSVTAAFTALPASRCAAQADADCIRAVYRGAPDDYAQVVDIPADALIAPDAEGRYHVERGEQVTVVTAALLPPEWTRFYLKSTPAGSPSPVSFQQLIPPVGTTYTFTPTEDESGSTLITFDLAAARPRPPSRPGSIPDLGPVVVTTVFQVETETFRYDSFDTTGEASTAGSYAFLMPDGTQTTAVTTYGQLRTESTVMRVNVSDEHGASWGSFYDAVAAGDVVEWHKAEDCWTRYRVVSAPAAAAGLATRDIGVKSVTYSYAGCDGAISAAAASTLAWGPLPNVRSSDVTTAVRHGPYLTAPAGWSGSLGTSEVHFPAGADELTRPTIAASNLDDARRLLPYWRDPVLPEGWTFVGAEAGGPNNPTIGHCALYFNAGGYTGAEICVRYKVRHPQYQPATGDASVVFEQFMLDGRPALVRYSPQGPAHRRTLKIIVWVFDEDTGIEYEVWGYDGILRGSDPTATIAIARSLLPTAAP